MATTAFFIKVKTKGLNPLIAKVFAKMLTPLTKAVRNTRINPFPKDMIKNKELKY